MDRLVDDDDEHPLVGIRFDRARANGTDRGTKSEDRRVVVVADKKENGLTFSTTVQKQRAVTNGMVWRRMIALFF
jgi:hypothetical protein